MTTMNLLQSLSMCRSTTATTIIFYFNCVIWPAFHFSILFLYIFPKYWTD